MPTNTALMSTANPYQGPLLPGQDTNAFRNYGIERSGGSNPAPSAPPPTQSAPPPAPAPANFNPKDRNQNPGEGWWWDAADGWKQVDRQAEQRQNEINDAYNPIFDLYNQAESNLRGQYPSLIAEADAQAQASRGLLQNEKLSANEMLNNQAQTAEQSRTNLTNQQRATLQELQQANQQRFGGASSAGQAAGEIQGREYQRNVYGINQQAQQVIQQVEQKRLEVDRTYQQGLQQLEVNTQKAKNELQRGFQDKLLEINAGRANTASEKAKMRMDALQELRNQAYQIDMAKFQFAAQLQMQREQNQAELEQVAAQYSGLNSAGNINPNQLSTPTSPIPSVQPTNSINNAVGYVSPSKKNETIGGMSYANPNINTSLMSMAR